MSFANGKLAKVWEKKANEKYFEVKISTSKKVKDTDTYEQDFSSYVRFIGKAAEKAKELKGDEMIKLLEVECTNKYDSEHQKTYYNFVVWDFEIYDKNKKHAEKTNNNNSPDDLQPIDDNELPF